MEELQRQMAAFSKAYGKKGKKITKRIEDLMNRGMSPKEAVRKAFAENDVLAWLEAEVPQVVLATAEATLGKDLAEEISTAAMLEALSNPWDGSGMNLSQKLHGAEREMRERIISTLDWQLKLNKGIKKTAEALYDGYHHGSVTYMQELPKYTDDLVNWVRRSRDNLSDEEKKALLKAIRKVKGQADGLRPDTTAYNHFRTSLYELLEKVDGVNKKSIERAIQTAVEEKSRYVAERIARTEAARARYDAFTARYGEDEDVVAYQWKLGSRHPAEDICDMYADADLYGLGKGVFPKDAAPASPAHPHCLCHYAPVYQSELEGKTRSHDFEGRGSEWLHNQPISVQEKILGVKGREEWKAGRAGWMEKARNFEILGIKESRLSEITPYSKRKKIEITDETIQKVKPFKYPGLSDAQNAIMQERQKELLKFAKDENNSNEVVFLLNNQLDIVGRMKGTESSTEFPRSISYSTWVLHNHPRSGGFSIDDVYTFCTYDSLKYISAIGNNGHIQSLTKTNKYDSLEMKKGIYSFLEHLFSSERYQSGGEVERDVMMTEMMCPLLSSLQARGLIIWKK